MRNTLNNLVTTDKFNEKLIKEEKVMAAYCAHRWPENPLIYTVRPEINMQQHQYRKIQIDVFSSMGICSVLFVAFHFSVVV